MAPTTSWGRLDVTRVGEPGPGAAPMSVRSLLGSVLVRLEPRMPTQLPAELAPHHRHIKVAVLLGSNDRCDAHALSQAQQAFLFSVYVEIPDYPVQRIVLSPDRSVQRRTKHLIDSLCGVSPG